MKRATAIGGFVFLVHVLALGTFRVSLLLMLITGTGVLIWTVRRRSESFWRRLATASLLACLLASAQRRSDLSRARDPCVLAESDRNRPAKVGAPGRFSHPQGRFRLR